MTDKSKPPWQNWPGAEKRRLLALANERLEVDEPPRARPLNTIWLLRCELELERPGLGCIYYLATQRQPRTPQATPEHSDVVLTEFERRVHIEQILEALQADAEVVAGLERVALAGMIGELQERGLIDQRWTVHRMLDFEEWALE